MTLQLIIRRNSKGTEHAIDLAPLGGELHIGRDSRNDIQIPLPFFSSQHLRIFTEGNQWYAEDLGSTNGTLYRGQRLKAGTRTRWEVGEPLIVQDLELTLNQESPHITLAHTGSLARRLLVDDANLSTTDLAFFEVQNGLQAGQRFALSDHTERFCFEVSNNAIGEASNGNLTVLREGDGFALITELSLQYDKAPYTSGTRIHSGSRIRHGALELLFYDPIEDLLPSPPNPPHTDLVGPESNQTDVPPQHEEGVSKKGISRTEWLVLAIAVFAILIGLTLLFVLFG